MPIVNITISPIDKAMKDKIIKNVTQVMHETTKIPRGPLQSLSMKKIMTI